MASPHRPSSPRRRLFMLSALLLAGILAFMLVKSSGNWDFLLKFRGQKVWVMLLVGSAIGLSTVVFQTLTGNRILTPSIIGLDALYLLSKMTVIFFFGAAAHIAEPARWQFLADTALMGAAATLFFTLLLPLLARDIYRLLLIGIIFGALCNKLTDLMGRMLDPTEYTYYQSIAYAQFNRVKPELLLPATLLILAAGAYLWHRRHALDIIALGRAQAIGLGIAYRRELLCLMLAVSALVATSTALVGPVVFFGLLVSALAYRLFDTPYHSILLPAAALLSATILIAGQTLFERLFGFAATLSIVIEALGGIAFLYLLLFRKRS